MPLVNGRFVADMKSPRTPDNEEPAAERACDFRPVDKGFTEEMALAEAERCLNCKKPFCVEGCPVNINIPRFIEQIRAKDFGGALDTIREDSMLPAICGRVCPQENQCEGKCIRGKKSEPVAIGQLERFLGDRPELAPTPKMPPKHGKNVVVFGGGNVAMDAVRTAKRLGAEHAIIAYRRTEDEMPCRRAELHHAKAEGVEVLPLVSPLEFVAGEDGSVCAVKVQKMELGEPDESGRRRPVAIEGAIEEIPCDVAISAIGTNANPFAAKIGGKMELNKWGYIVADEETGQTTDPRIWAGGDIVTGAATVILAMGAGKKAAASITKSLLGE